MGPKVVQPPEGRIPSVKPIELGVEPNGHLSQQPVPHPNIWVVQEGSLQENPHKGHLMLEGEGIKMDRRRTNPHLDPFPEKIVEMEVMVMVVMVEMMMGMMMMMMMKTMMRMMKLKQLLRVKMEKIQMHLLVEVHQEEMVVEVMDHHLIWGLEMCDLEVEGDIEVKEDEEGGWVHKVYQVYGDCKDLRALRD